MAGYPYGNQNPQFPQQNQMYPQLYNAPVPVPGYPGQNPQQIQPQPGFPYPYQGQPQAGQPNHPASMSYPGMPSAPPPFGMQAYPAPGMPVAPTPVQPVEWLPSTPLMAHTLSDRAIIAGYEGHDGSPLWIIRARIQGDLVPGKLAIKHNAAYVPWGGVENNVEQFEVCCGPPERFRWVECRDGAIPPQAVVGGNTSSGEPLYVGRAKEQASLTPGKVHPSHKAMYISFAGKEVAHKIYEVLCTV